MVIIIKMN